MVTLNLTIFVEVGLFLLFLWLMNTFVFRPLLQLMDRREAKIEEDKAQAHTEAIEAEELEGEYASNVAVLHRDATHKRVTAHRKAQQVHTERVDELKKREEEEVAQVHAEAMKEIEAQRKHYAALTADLVDAASARLGIGGDKP